MDSGVVTLTALVDVPRVEPGDDLAALVVAALDRSGIVPRDHDILVLAQKIVSKSEGRYASLRDVVPSPRARELAIATGKDPRLVELILGESRDVVRIAPGVLIVEHRLGFVVANAGIDQSNIEHPAGNERALLLPLDPDASCACLKAKLDSRFGADLGVVISDSWGRPWRKGVTGVALGAAGVPALQDLVGAPDLFGRTMRATEVAFADEVAAAASMLMGETDAGRPVVHVRGLAWNSPARPVADVLRPRTQDLFR